MVAFDYQDRLELLGVVVGVFLILGSLGTLVGQPWATNPDVAAVLLQLVGVVLTIGLGAALIWIVRSE